MVWYYMLHAGPRDVCVNVGQATVLSKDHACTNKCQGRKWCKKLCVYIYIYHIFTNLHQKKTTSHLLPKMPSNHPSILWLRFDPGLDKPQHPLQWRACPYEQPSRQGWGTTPVTRKRTPVWLQQTLRFNSYIFYFKVYRSFKSWW